MSQYDCQGTGGADGVQAGLEIQAWHSRGQERSSGDQLRQGGFVLRPPNHLFTGQGDHSADLIRWQVLGNTQQTGLVNHQAVQVTCLRSARRVNHLIESQWTGLVDYFDFTGRAMMGEMPGVH